MRAVCVHASKTGVYSVSPGAEWSPYAINREGRTKNKIEFCLTVISPRLYAYIWSIQVDRYIFKTNTLIRYFQLTRSVHGRPPQPCRTDTRRRRDPPAHPGIGSRPRPRRWCCTSGRLTGEQRTCVISVLFGWFTVSVHFTS